jgi:hypothetical protein
MKPHPKQKPDNNTTTDTKNSYNNPPNMCVSLSTLRETTFARTSMRFHCNEPSYSQSANIRYDLLYLYYKPPPKQKQTNTHTHARTHKTKKE